MVGSAVQYRKGRVVLARGALERPEPAIDDPQFPPAARSTPSASPPPSLAWVQTLRATALVSVVWFHTVAVWLLVHHEKWAPETALSHLTDSIRMGHDGGILGVCVFFLLSGYVVTMTAQGATRAEFALKRLSRVYPMLVPFMFGMVLVVRAHILPASAWAGNPVTVGKMLQEISLLAWYSPGRPVVDAITWTLAVELLFYGLLWLVLPLWRSRPLAVPTFVAVVCGLGVLTDPGGATAWHAVAQSLAPLPLIVMGQLLLFTKQERVSPWCSLLWAPGCLLFLHWTLAHEIREYLGPSFSFMQGAVAGTAVVAVLALTGFPRRNNRLTSWIADNSYGLYISHVTIGWPVLALVTPWAPFSVALMCALAADAVAARILTTCIDGPVHRGVRRWLRRQRRKRDASAGSLRLQSH